MLNESELVGYLLEHRLVSPAAIVASDLTIVDVSRRNRNFKVLTDRGPCLLIKQSDDDGGGPGTLAHEAAAYRFLARCAGSSWPWFLPKLHRFDAAENILILELTTNAENLRRLQVRQRAFSRILARRIGAALGWLHSQSPATAGGFESHFRHPALALVRPDSSILVEVSSANLDLLRTIQAYPAFRRHLGDLGDDWQPVCLLHGDFKWDNCIAFAAPGATRTTRLRIVDWEFAGMGDPCWDIGSVFSDYLTTWLMSIPLLGEGTPERWVDLAAFPLESMHPAIDAFWRSYCAEAGLGAGEAGQTLTRSIRFSAARLLQTAYEYMHESITLTGNIYCFLQLALNLLERPGRAGVHLLGLPSYRTGER